LKLQFTSLIRLPLIITKIEDGYIETNSWEPIVFFKRKIGSIADFVYMDRSEVGRLNTDKVIPWYEYTASYLGGSMCPSVYLLPVGYIETGAGKINLSGSSMLAKMPLNLYHKDDVNSNTFGLMNSFGSVVDDYISSSDTLRKLRDFGTLNPFTPDCEFSFFSESDQIEHNGIRLKSVNDIDSIIPSSYIKAGKKKQLHFGFDLLNFFTVKTPYYMYDECNIKHSIIFQFDTTNKILNLITEDTADKVGSYYLFDYDGVAVKNICGLDFVDNYIYILTENKLLQYYMPSYKASDITAIVSVPVTLDSDCHGLKMGSSFFTTLSSDFIVYIAEYNSFTSQDKLYTTYGNVQSIIEMCSPDVLIKPANRKNIETILDNQLDMFGFKRTTGVRAGEFLLIVSCVNMNMLNRTNDPVGVILHESELYYARHRIQDLGHGIDEITFTREGVIALIEKFYTDSLSTLKWGQIIR